ncbi:ImmA/IrrE family metallo-endopeptidase [Agrobacterium rhizogenes]|uniref:ImmA/IrrE family metallo-endopeptidase n=1 Tax=Rhizobium rhizogenes TaxID=359 RepID=UPI0022B67566|nr:ImmA/IrrE family metallo-endopeptidase [Rhizobium rhizogenes]MCZ7449470.1 ImmA/IrrE family metallo-endopeptidase [Rhizobium rhizogenes]
MARDIFISTGLSATTVNALAKATRSICDISDDQHLDIIKFLEIDVLRIIPDFYLFIENDDAMSGSKAFVTEDSKCIVVAESVYNDAVGGLFYARKILAHEFGHVLLHHNKGFETKHFTFDGYKKQIRDTENFHSAEWQADTFAILLLIPLSQIDGSTPETEISKKYNMSPRQAAFVLNRLKSIRRRGNIFDVRAVNKLIKSIYKKSPLLAPEGEAQLSFFA